MISELLDIYAMTVTQLNTQRSYYRVYFDHVMEEIVCLSRV